MVTGFTLRFYEDAGCVPGDLIQEMYVPGDCGQRSVYAATFAYEAPVSFHAAPGVTYWFSVQADLQNLPSWGRLASLDVTGCNSTFRGAYWSYPDWIDIALLVGFDWDASQEFECRSAVEIDHLSLDSTEQEDVPFFVDAVIAGYGHALDPEQIWIEYRVESPGEWHRIAMQYAGGGHWQASIPGQTQPAELAYYIHAEDIMGNWAVDPPGGNLDPHLFDVAWLAQLFEEDDGGFIVNPDGDDGATQGIWVHVDPRGGWAQPEDDHTSYGTLCWVTGIPGFYGSGVSGGRTTLQSAVYDLTGAFGATAKYYRWYSNDIPWGENPGTDVWLVQVRNGGGGWVDVENTTTSSNEWVQVEVDLEELFGESLGQIEFRFVASDDADDSIVEAAVDDFVILVEDADPTSATEIHAEEPRYALLDASPNPFQPGTMIPFAVPAPTRVDLTIHDVSGRQIRALLEGEVVSAGEHTRMWNGMSDDGHRVRSGLYFVRMLAGSFRATRSLVLVR